jgi:hypothetical protein
MGRKMMERNDLTHEQFVRQAYAIAEDTDTVC